MMCYRDRTFCGFYTDCKYGGKCEWALTPKVKAGVRASGFRLAEYTDKPECWKKK